MAYPILAPNSTWYKSSAARSTITEINIVDSYTPTGSENETWNADVDDSGSIKCYITGTVLTIAGNGSEKIAANADSSYMFADSAAENLFGNVITINNLGTFDTSNVTTMKSMFLGCVKLQSVDLSTWDVHNVTTMNYMFGGHTDYGGNMSLVSIGDTSNWNTTSLTNTRCMFQSCDKITGIYVSNWDVSKVTTMEYMFTQCSSLATLDVSNWDVSSVTTMKTMFNKCSSLTTLDVSNWDVSKVTDMSMMFCQCSSLTTLDVSNWDVSKVTTMKAMFQAGSYGSNPFKLTTLDVSKWDTSSCTDMSFMFYGIKGTTHNSTITIDMSNWDVSKVTNFDHMFANGSATITDVSKWNTSSATNMNAMFHHIDNTSIDVSSFDTSKVTAFSQMFEYSKLEKIIGLENFDTSQSVGFEEMFAYCTKLRELNLSSFDTRKAKDGVTVSTNGHTTKTLSAMFSNMHCLEKITFGENFSFDGDGTTDMVSRHAVLPTPSAAYIDGADGNWYDVDGNFYEPNSITDGVRTYYASPDLIPTVDLIKRGTMVKFGNVLRAKSDSTQKYTPLEMVSEFNNLESAGSYNQGYENGQTSMTAEPWTFTMVDGSIFEMNFYSSSIVIPSGEIASIDYNGRNIFSKSTTLLPFAYQQVEYLDSYSTSTNKPYIDTGFIFTGNVCEFLWRGGGLDGTLGHSFGSKKNNTERFDMYAYYSSSAAYVQIGAADNSIGGMISSSHNAGRIIGFIANETDETNKYFSIWDYTNNTAWRDSYGNARENIVYTGTCKTGKSNYLFFANGGTYQNSFRYEYAAFREDGVMKREFIPCYRKSDRKAGMFDLVTKTFYTNVGTGEFEIGADVV